MSHISQLDRGLAAVLDEAPTRLNIDDLPHLHGFGGLHGGLLVARMIRVASTHAGDRVPRSVLAQFHRPARGALELRVHVTHTGRAVTTVDVEAAGARGLTTRASVLFTTDDATPANPRQIEPRPPDVPAPDTLERFEVPTEFVPIAPQTEIRPVGAARPFADGPTAALVAWMRIVGDRSAPDPARLAFLLDALAPAHSAVLADLAVMPTVQFAANFTSPARCGESPWVLMRATSSHAAANGWLQEDLDVWDREGTHLASARQLRLVGA